MFLLVGAPAQVGVARGADGTVSVRRLQRGARTLPSLHTLPLLSVSHPHLQFMYVHEFCVTVNFTELESSGILSTNFL